ncbi:MAG: hypoxanthine-guanine phosphoribosyltransferase [Sulfuriferula sp.]
MINNAKAWRILDEADLIYTAAEVQAAITSLAYDISARFKDTSPLVLSVMGGAVVFSGQILPRLHFPLDFDYIHATRYGKNLRGGELEWLVEPREPVAGRTVLLLDDILDEGHTLASIRNRLLQMGAVEVSCAVLTEKHTGQDKPIRADFVGLVLPNRYVFGCGMDVEGAWRNLPAIYAMKDVPT